MTSRVEEIAAQWASELPRDFTRQLAAALRTGADDVAALAARAAQPNSAAAVRAARRLVASGEGAYAAGLLAGRLATLDEQPDITPVWTGPWSGVGHSRLTLAVVADLVNRAEREILLVSYATVPGKAVREAFAAAVERGVAVTLLLERHADNAGFKRGPEPFPGLAARRLHWPATARPSGASMHAKLLIIDRCTALVGSANLTGSALEDNLECGLLIRGGPIPDLLARHLDQAEGIRELL